MSQSILYGVDTTNTLHEIHHTHNGMAACLPIWDYLDNKYCPNQKELIFFSKRPCWQLTPQTLSNEEYFLLLSSFDGYFFTREHLPEMIDLLKLTHLREYHPIKSTRLALFEAALANTDYDKFFIIATTVANYGEYIEYHCDDLDKETLKNTVWNIWETYNNDINKEA